MAYKSLYRTYRPQVFSEVSGQEAIITTLKNAIDEHRIAHAYLFCGPRGTGKTTIAKLFAKAVNCTGEVKPCGECANCKAIENGTHQDVIEIDAASNNSVEEVRNLIDKVKYAPVEGQYKVYIIDEVHMMTASAFNALLKTLEEPPEHVIFILATTEPHKILPTIISRCQRFDFSSLTEKEMVQRMETVLNEEHKEYEPGALSLIAKLANGGMRDALSILEQCLAYNNNILTEKDVNSIYGILSLEDKINFIKVLLAKNMRGALELTEKIDASGIDIKRLTYDLIDILKDVVIYKNTSNTQILTVLSQSYLDEIIPYISSDDALKFIDILLNASEKFMKSTNAHIYFEMAILKICNQEHTVIEEKVPEVKVPQIKHVQHDKPLEDKKEVMNDDTIIEQVEEILNEEKPQFNFEEKKSIETYDDDINVDQNDLMNILVQADRKILKNIQEKWPILKRYMSNMNTAKAASMLSEGHPVAACSNAIIIAFEHMPDVNAINYYKNYKQLSALIKDVFSEEFKFVGIQADAWLSLRNYYIQQRKNNSLPKPGPIKLTHIDIHDLDHVELNEAQKFALELFGNEIVEFTED